MGTVTDLADWKAKRAICALCRVLNVAFVVALFVGALFVLLSLFRGRA